MDARPEEEKQSGPGKRAAVMQKQTAEYIKPLLRLLKKRVSPIGKIRLNNELNPFSHAVIGTRYFNARS